MKLYVFSYDGSKVEEKDDCWHCGCQSKCLIPTENPFYSVNNSSQILLLIMSFCTNIIIIYLLFVIIYYILVTVISRHKVQYLLGWKLKFLETTEIKWLRIKQCWMRSYLHMTLSEKIYFQVNNEKTI